MKIRVLPDEKSLGAEAAIHAAESLRQLLHDKGEARIIVATGASQFDFLEALTREPDIMWNKVEMFHLDEYIGIPASHPASFRKYLQERILQRTGITKYHLLDGDGDVQEVMDRVGRELLSRPIDLAFLGIGENGHLAFNDPPANFEIESPYLVVELDEACCQQQVNEGWFNSLSEVPRQAISISIRQILKSREILVIAGGERKALAVQACLENEITPLAPASILQTHAHTTIYLDRDSASLLRAALTTCP